MNILLTGSSGFIGQYLITKLKHEGISFTAADRDMLSTACKSIESNKNQITNTLKQALSECDTVIHLAARVHIMNESSANPLEAFRKSNVEMTRHLAEMASVAGVKRFVFVSSIKVNGEESDVPYTEMDIAKPKDDYGVSKWEAEQALHEISANTGLEVVIIRPTLVYGAGVRGNFSQMMKVLAKGLPLPLASVQNLRSLIYVENLVDAIILCAKHPSAAGQTYIVSDGEDVSTPALIHKLSNIMGKKTFVFPCPIILLHIFGKLFNKDAQIQRLTGNLKVDSSKIRRELGWRPPYSLHDGLVITVKGLTNKATGD